MTMEARIISDRQQWDDFVASSLCCNITQAYEWGELYRHLGAVEALRVGVSGFLLKDTAPTDLAPAVLAAATGEVVLCQPVVRRLVTMVLDAVDRRRDRALDLARGLCERELEVARLVGEGMSNPEIGRELSISVAMVKVHVSRLLVKLGLHNRVQIAVFADSAGLAVRSDSS